MTTDTHIALLIFPMVQAVFFGIGTIAIVATPLSAWAMVLMPPMIVLTMVLSLPVSRIIAPRLRARFERHQRLRFIRT
jgi:hypothetical protein